MQLIQEDFSTKRFQASIIVVVPYHTDLCLKWSLIYTHVSVKDLDKYLKVFGFEKNQTSLHSTYCALSDFYTTDTYKKSPSSWDIRKNPMQLLVADVMPQTVTSAFYEKVME